MKKCNANYRLSPATAAFPMFAGVFYCGVFFGFKIALICAVLTAVAGCAVYVLFRHRFPRICCFLSPASVCALLFSLFALVRYFEAVSPLQTLLCDSDIMFLEGQALSSPQRTSNGNYTLSFRVENALSRSLKASAVGRVRLLLKPAAVEAYYPGRLYSAATSRHDEAAPFVEQGSRFTAQVRHIKDSLFLCEQIGQVNWTNGIARLRADFRLQLKRVLYVWGEAGGFLLALLSGSREYLNENLALAFKNAGLSHILALSGMHLSLFGGLSASLARLLSGKKNARFVSLLCMCLFVWFAGASPSLVRALLCAILLSLASLCGLSVSVIPALCASFIIQILFFPADAVQLSFLLSYAALFGILTAGTFIGTKIPFPARVCAPVASSCGAQLFTAPICVRFFSCLMPAGIPASVAVSPLASLFLIVGLFCLTISLIFPFLLYPLGFIMRLLYECVRLPVMLFSRIPLLMLRG